MARINSLGNFDMMVDEHLEQIWLHSAEYITLFSCYEYGYWAASSGLSNKAHEYTPCSPEFIYFALGYQDFFEGKQCQLCQA